jgi:hypothetical protein
MRTRFDVPDAPKFIGLDAYQKLIDLPDIDLVILAHASGLPPVPF